MRFLVLCLFLFGSSSVFSQSLSEVKDTIESLKSNGYKIIYCPSEASSTLDYLCMLDELEFQARFKYMDSQVDSGKKYHSLDIALAAIRAKARYLDDIVAAQKAKLAVFGGKFESLQTYEENTKIDTLSRRPKVVYFDKEQSRYIETAPETYRRNALEVLEKEVAKIPQKRFLSQISDTHRKLILEHFNQVIRHFATLPLVTEEHGRLITPFEAFELDHVWSEMELN